MQLPLTVDRTNVPYWWRVLDASASPVAHCYDEDTARALARAMNAEGTTMTFQDERGIGWIVVLEDAMGKYRVNTPATACLTVYLSRVAALDARDRAAVNYGGRGRLRVRRVRYTVADYTKESV